MENDKWKIKANAKALFRHDRFDLVAFQESDHSVAAIPDAVFGAPDLVRIDLATAGQHDYGFAALSRSNAWSTRRDGIRGGARVSRGDSVCRRFWRWGR